MLQKHNFYVFHEKETISFWPSIIITECQWYRYVPVSVLAHLYMFMDAYLHPKNVTIVLKKNLLISTPGFRNLHRGASGLAFPP